MNKMSIYQSVGELKQYPSEKLQEFIEEWSALSKQNPNLSKTFMSKISTANAIINARKFNIPIGDKLIPMPRKLYPLGEMQANDRDALAHFKRKFPRITMLLEKANVSPVTMLGIFTTSLASVAGYYTGSMSIVIGILSYGLNNLNDNLKVWKTISEVYDKLQKIYTYITDNEEITDKEGVLKELNELKDIGQSAIEITQGKDVSTNAVKIAETMASYYEIPSEIKEGVIAGVEDIISGKIPNIYADERYSGIWKKFLEIIERWNNHDKMLEPEELTAEEKNREQNKLLMSKKEALKNITEIKRFDRGVNFFGNYNAIPHL